MKSAVNILLVEDEAFAAMTLRTILNQVGYTDCRVVAIGGEASTAFRKKVHTVRGERVEPQTPFDTLRASGENTV